MAALTKDTDPTLCGEADWRACGVVYKNFSGQGTDETEISAASATGTKHVIVLITLDIDTAGISIGVTNGTTARTTLRMPVVSAYRFPFPEGFEMPTTEAISLNKSDASSAVTGRIYYIPNAKPGYHVPKL